MIISMGVLSMISCEDKFAEAENEVIETSKTSEGGGNNDPEGGDDDPDGGG